MKSVDKPYRLAVFNAINGLITYNSVNIPVYDELKSGQDSGVKVFILLSTQQSIHQPYEGVEARTAKINLEIVAKSGSEVSKDVLDTIEEELVNIIFPNPLICTLVAPPGFVFNETFWEQSTTLTTMISPTESLLRKIITITSIITQ